MLYFGAGVIAGWASVYIVWMIHTVQSDGKFLSKITSDSREDTNVE